MKMGVILTHPNPGTSGFAFSWAIYLSTFTIRQNNLGRTLIEGHINGKRLRDYQEFLGWTTLLNWQDMDMKQQWDQLWMEGENLLFHQGLLYKTKHKEKDYIYLFSFHLRLQKLAI